MKTLIDDGFNPELVETALFNGVMEIPELKEPDRFSIPEVMVPFSKRHRCKDPENNFICFYEHDLKFKDILVSPNKYLDELKLFKGIISPDCSLYWDMPLCLQIANIYMNRAIAYFYQSHGIDVIPNVRWGDERTFTTDVLPEKVAFLGIPKHSIVAIGTYGCVKGKEEQLMFRKGLIAMLDELEPEIVLVYGSMPELVFSDLLNRTRFIKYPDWISFKRRSCK